MVYLSASRTFPLFVFSRPHETCLLAKETTVLHLICETSQFSLSINTQTLNAPRILPPTLRGCKALYRIISISFFVERTMGSRPKSIVQ
jgi:hypothetical protein